LGINSGHSRNIGQHRIASAVAKMISMIMFLCLIQDVLGSQYLHPKKTQERRCSGVISSALIGAYGSKGA
jgi:hypothetical protein